MSDVLYNDAQQAQRKLFYSLSSVSLGSLALSIQFGPSMGKELCWMLILAWGLLFISAVAGGWRLGKETATLRNMYLLNTTQPHEKEAKEKLDRLIEENDKPINCLTKVQIWSLILGQLANLIFAGANYLAKS